MPIPLEAFPDNIFPNTEHKLRLFRLRRSLSLLERNYKELKETLNTIENPQAFIDILIGDDTDEIDRLILEVERQLVNFVSMAKALVDTNRKVIKEWYEVKVKVKGSANTRNPFY